MSIPPQDVTRCPSCRHATSCALSRSSRPGTATASTCGGCSPTPSGSARTSTSSPAPRLRSMDDEPILIPDHDYPPEFWHDADRE